MTNHNSQKLIISSLFYLLFFLSFSQQKQSIKYLDLATKYIDEEPKKAVAYLDSIPQPIEKNIKGNLANYYYLKAISNNALNQQAEIYNNFLLALKYAEIEKDYNIAGMASLELFYNIYLVKRDSSAIQYLNNAKTYFEKSNNTNGLSEVKQMYAYIAFQNKNYKKSNTLLLQHLQEYKAIKSDAYYYMYALFMLSTNYLYLNNVEQANVYFNSFLELETNKTLSPSLYKKHEVTIYNCFADYYNKNKNVKALKTYLNKAQTLRAYMNDADIENYLKLNSDYYSLINNIELKNNFVDSLKIFHEIKLKETLDASLKINNTLINTEKDLQIESAKKKQNQKAVLIVTVLLLGFVVFVILRYKKIKQKISAFSKRNEEYNYMQSNHEKLKVKVRGLEDYISQVKKEIKSISTVNDVAKQRYRIKELYTELHLNSSTIIDKSKNHLELVNDLNIDFFNTLNKNHPELDDSEIIICYYLHIGFKNKEIAVFLNKSLRAIENKRFRIGKKLNIKEKHITLIAYLNALFPENKNVV